MKYLFPLLLLITVSSYAAEKEQQLDPKSRARDYVQAFEILRKEKSVSRVYFKTISGTLLQNIMEMTPMENGSLILFKLNTPQGIKYQVVKVEEIVTLHHN